MVSVTRFHVTEAGSMSSRQKRATSSEVSFEGSRCSGESRTHAGEVGRRVEASRRREFEPDRYLADADALEPGVH